MDNRHAWSEISVRPTSQGGALTTTAVAAHLAVTVRAYLGYVFGWKRKSPRTPCTEDDGEAEAIAQGLACYFLDADEGDLWFAETSVCGEETLKKEDRINQAAHA